jgi:hypothetical protein
MLSSNSNIIQHSNQQQSQQNISNNVCKNTTQNSISIPIPIPIPSSSSTENIKVIEEYSLKCNIFNPGKMSPPNIWKCRLEQRIKAHYSNNIKDSKE